MKAIVVGAGITGVSSAIWLRRAGVEVTLIDRVRPGDPAQTSFGNGGILARCAVVPVPVPGLLAKAPRMLLDPSAPLFMRWSYLPRLIPWLVPFLRSGRMDRLNQIVRALDPLTGDSVEQHLSLSKGTEAESYIKTGDYIYLYRSRAAYEADGLSMGLRAQFGYEPRLMDAAELRAQDPHLSSDYTFGAAFADHGWIHEPGPYVAALARHFEALGGEFCLGDVADVRSGQVQLVGGQTMTGDRIVLAGGVWSRRLAERLGHRVPMESERGYHLMLTGTNLAPPLPYMIADAKFVATPMEGGLRCAGIVEFGGLDAPPSEAPLALLRARIREVYPQLTWEHETSWMGHRPSTSDSLPVIGESPRAPGVIFAFGGQHVGLTMGPRVGRMVAGLATGAPPNIDLAPYQVDRFD